MSDAWKSFQRWTCRFFGMECGWRGEEDECYDTGPTLDCPTRFAPEVKYRQRFPNWLTDAWTQAVEYAERVGKPYPIVVLGTARQNRMDSLVVMDLRHFDWLMKEAGLKPNDRNKESMDEHTD